jgi:NAD(P)H-flavin reductase
MRLLILLLLTVAVNGYREYLRYYPNAGLTPCLSSGANCYNTNICNAGGHANCVSSSDLNSFGKGFQDDNYKWTSEVCQKDYDGDGLTNGDELGDPCCVWSVGDVPTRFTNLSHPGDANSVNSLPSCKLAGVPTSSVISNVTYNSTSDGSLVISWTYDLTSACVCYSSVVISGSTSTSTFSYITNIPRSQSTASITICGLSTSDNFTVSITPSNLNGTSTSSYSFSTGTLSSVVFSGDAETVTCTVAATSFPTASGTYSSLIQYGLIAGLASILFVLVVMIPLNRSKLSKCEIALKKALFYKRPFFRSELSIFDVIMITLVVGTLLAFTYQWKKSIDSVTWPWNDRAYFGRIIGGFALVGMTLVLLPVTKHSVWVPLIGLPLDKGVHWHEIVGTLTFVCIAIHGISMILNYNSAAFGISFIFNGEKLMYSGLAGFASGVIFAIVGVFALIEPIRRARYGWFIFSHFFSIVGIIAGFIHYTPLAYYMGIGLILVAIDFILLAMTNRLYPSKITGMEAIEEGSEKFTLLTITRKANSLASTDFRTNSLLYVLIPSLSKLPHYFSVVHVERDQARNVDVITLCIKAMPGTEKRKTWTEKLYEIASASTENAEYPSIVAFGPFSCSALSLEKYDQLLLVGGGIGVTPLIYICQRLAGKELEPGKPFKYIFNNQYWKQTGQLEDAPAPAAAEEQVEMVNQDAANNEESIVEEKSADETVPMKKFSEGSKKISLVWTLRSWKLAERLFPYMHISEQDAEYSLGVNVCLGGGHAHDNESRPQLKAGALGPHVSTKLDFGRPNLKSLLNSVKEKAHAQGVGTIGIVVCGPPQMCSLVSEYAHYISDRKVEFHVQREQFYF